MLRDYDDIRKRLGEPLWWDGNGVPRYDPFTPEQCGIYDRHVAFMEIACQACGETFMVASEWGGTYEHLVEKPALPDFTKGSGWDAVGSFHYGDPPRHSKEDGCMSGDTMNSIPVEVIEFWSKDWISGKDDPNKEFDKLNPFGWTRHPEYEGKFPEETPDEKENDGNQIL
jgi:hypothetical protein